MTHHNHEIIVCRCEEVTETEILDALKEGATSLNDIKRKTRAGMGLCQGRTCRRIISQMMANATNRPIEEILPSTFRPPVRPIKLSSVAGENDAER